MLERPLRCHKPLRLWDRQGNNFGISMNYTRWDKRRYRVYSI